MAILYPYLFNHNKTNIVTGTRTAMEILEKLAENIIFSAPINDIKTALIMLGNYD